MSFPRIAGEGARRADGAKLAPPDSNQAMVSTVPPSTRSAEPVVALACGEAT